MFDPVQLRRVLVGALSLAVCACGSGKSHDNDTTSSQPPMLAVLSAFPGELEAVLEHTAVDSTEMIGDHLFRIGMLNGVPVVVGMTGIGLVNAATTTRAVLDRFPVEGVIVSAVAGGPYVIGSVAVPEVWLATDGSRYAADQNWLALADELATSRTVSFESCVLLPARSPDPICMIGELGLFVGGVGRSADPFNDMVFPCTPDGTLLSGCDVPAGTTPAQLSGEAIATTGDVASETMVSEDMETAAIAAAVTGRGLPFIAFRAVSDGPGDPLGLPGFPTQFFAYYRLAAHNAAAAAAALLDKIATEHR